MTLLLHNYLSELKQKHQSDFFSRLVPSCISENLRKDFGKREYQQEAFGRFIYYLDQFHPKPANQPLQLLFHMATGSGKTLVMAGLILYLYQKGYRNFLFFVNSTNIIEKTQDNFLNAKSSKYLFAPEIIIGKKRVRIKAVDNFQNSGTDHIHIAFSTIQGLHARFNTPRENSLSYDDFENQKMVLISDEAHHINVETRKRSELKADEREKIISWESTVNRIFKAHGENMLLEFTATADIANPRIAKKYSEKLIFDYPLRQFRAEGYSKEVKVLQADLPPFTRALQALLLSQYRRKLFEKHKLPVKPVILFKSRTIKESQQFWSEFTTQLQNLTTWELEKIRDVADTPVLAKFFSFLKENQTSLEHLTTELKHEFAPHCTLVVNSKDESEQKQLAVNSLEDRSNPYRLIFAVDKLNEGWDVLNLFDIVRLYNTRDARQNQPGKTTMAEAQLIGRGARYFPFSLEREQDNYRRKYDKDLTHELRTCEELYYHSAYNPQYITELNSALVKTGIKAHTTFTRVLTLKDSFRETDFFKNGVLFLNQKEKVSAQDEPPGLTNLHHNVFLYKVSTGKSIVSDAFEQPLQHEKASKEITKDKESTILITGLGEHALRKAINKIPFYRFSQLLTYFPELQSLKEFIFSKNYLGGIFVRISGINPADHSFTHSQKIQAATDILLQIAGKIQSRKKGYTGTCFHHSCKIQKLFTNKVLHFDIDNPTHEHAGHSFHETHHMKPHGLEKQDWYVFEDCFGNHGEKEFILLFHSFFGKLSSHFDQIWLIKNDRFFQIYQPRDGKGIYPSFVIVIIDRTRNLQQQLFLTSDPAVSASWEKQLALLAGKELQELKKLTPYFTEAYL